MDENKKILFEQKPVRVLFFQLCIPALVTILVTVLYHMADLFFVGKTGNTDAIAAVSLGNPIFTLLQAVGTLIGSGGCTMIGIALGQDDKTQIHRITSFSFYASMTVGLLLALVCFAGRDSMLQILGADINTVSYTSAYVLTIAAGAPLIIFSSVFSNIIRATGHAGKAMIASGMGTLLNIILDPFMILGLQMGVAGAAAATVIGNLASCIYLLVQIRKTPEFSLHIRFLKGSGKVSAKVLAVGLPSSLSTALQTLAFVILNHFLLQYGNLAVSAMGIASKVSALIPMMQMGVCLGIQPVISYAYGKGNWKRITELLKKVALITILFGAILTFICVVFRSALIRVFIDDSAINTLGEKFLVGLVLAGPVYGIYQLVITFLQSTENAFLASVTSTLRQGAVYIVVVILSDRFWGISGLTWAQAVSDFISLAAALVFMGLQYKQCMKKLRTKEGICYDTDSVS